MQDLFNKNVEDEIVKRQNELKQYFIDRVKNNIAPSDELNNKVTKYKSYKMYHDLVSSECNVMKQIRAKIIEVLNKHPNLFDISPEEFRKRFPAECWQLMFELIMADFLDQKEEWKLNKVARQAQGLPDIEFEYDQVSYFMECTTCSSSRLDQYDQLLPKFDHFFELAKFFHKKTRDRFWYCNIEHWWKGFTILNKEELQKILGNNDLNIILEDFKKWVFLNRYACNYFHEFVPDIILEKLKIIDFPIKIMSNENIDMSLVIKRIAEKIIEKLERPYFLNGKKGIIAISFATFSPSVVENAQLTRSINTLGFNNINSILNELIKNKKLAEQRVILDGLKNLYAILIYTTWYNWFPDIDKSSYFNQSSDHNNNYYAVIYNPVLLEDNSRNYLFSHMNS